MRIKNYFLTAVEYLRQALSILLIFLALSGVYLGLYTLIGYGIWIVWDMPLTNLFSSMLFAGLVSAAIHILCLLIRAR